MHRLGQGRVREDRVDELLFRRLEVHGDDEALDQFGHLGADHMGAEELPGLGIEDGLDQPVRLAERDGLAVADEGEAADLDSRPASFALASVRPTEAICGWQ